MIRKTVFYAELRGLISYREAHDSGRRGFAIFLKLNMVTLMKIILRSLVLLTISLCTPAFAAAMYNFETTLDLTWKTQGTVSVEDTGGTLLQVTALDIELSRADWAATFTWGIGDYLASNTFLTIADGNLHGLLELNTSDTTCAPLAIIADTCFVKHPTAGVAMWLNFGRQGPDKVDWDFEVVVLDATGHQYSDGDHFTVADVAVVPVPATIWLFGTALVGLVGFSKRKSRIAA